MKLQLSVEERERERMRERERERAQSTDVKGKNAINCTINIDPKGEKPEQTRKQSQIAVIFLIGRGFFPFLVDMHIARHPVHWIILTHFSSSGVIGKSPWRLWGVARHGKTSSSSSSTRYP